MNIHILMGLPGSGKTTWAKRHVRNKLARAKEEDIYFHCEHYDLDTNPNIHTLLNRLFVGPQELIIDGLIHTNKQLLSLITLIHTFAEPSFLHIHYWEEDRKQCLLNDRYRRSLSSKVSIKHLPLEAPNEEVLELLGLDSYTITRHKVPVKPDWLVFSDKYKLGCTAYDRYMRSTPWSLGGKTYNYWDEVEELGEEYPVEFYEFYNLMATLSIDLRQHWDISDLSYIEEREETEDHYGSYVKYAQYVCDVEALYNLLNSKGLVPPL